MEGVIVLAVMVALLAVALIADRVAVICAQDRLARQIQDRGFSVKPYVTIAGFPFLTQVAAGRLNKIMIRAAGKHLGPLEVRHLDLTLHGIRGGGNGRTASQLSGTALIGFAGLAGMTVICAGGIPMALLGSLRDTTVPLPVLPPGMTIKGVSVTGQGVLVHIAGQNVSFGTDAAARAHW